MSAHEITLLRAQGGILRKRAGALREQLEAQMLGAHALEQEVDLFANALEGVLRENASLRLEKETLLERVTRLERDLAGKTMELAAMRSAAGE